MWHSRMKNTTFDSQMYCCPNLTNPVSLTEERMRLFPMSTPDLKADTMIHIDNRSSLSKNYILFF